MAPNFELHDEVRIGVERAIADHGAVNLPVLAAQLHAASPREDRDHIERLVLGFAEMNGAAVSFDSHEFEAGQDGDDVALVIEFTTSECDIEAAD